MTRTWCMRYEAKHSYFKRLAAYMGNFINVAFTLADRHQTHTCYITNNSTGNVKGSLYRSKETTVGKYIYSFLVYIICCNASIPLCILSTIVKFAGSSLLLKSIE